MRRVPLWVGVAGAFALLACAIGLQMVRDSRYSREAREEERILYVRSGEAMRRIALSFDALASDVYWIRALQHYGGDRLSGRQQRYELLYPLLDLTTSLDPYFTIAYRFGAIFLSEGSGGGPGRADQAVALLKKGIAAEPGKWQYFYELGFVYYWHAQDMKTAAQWFRRAHAQPRAPNWLEPLAATILVEGGDRSAARFMWTQLLKAEEDWLRRTAQRGLDQLQALDDIDRLQAILARFPPPPGERYSWQWLIRRGVLRMEPRDPRGTPYVLDPATGTVTVSTESELHPMPAPRRLQ